MGYAPCTVNRCSQGRARCLVLYGTGCARIYKPTCYCRGGGILSTAVRADDRGCTDARAATTATGAVALITITAGPVGQPAPFTSGTERELTFRFAGPIH